jgi:phage baseplate assembly protein gpV
MSVALYDSIARIARHEVKSRAIAGVGRVVSLFPADGSQPDHAVTIEMRDSGLVLPRVPVAVGTMGFAAIPDIDDLVVVIFLDGDLNAPVVVGRLYHVDTNPPKHGEGELVLHLPAGAANPDFQLTIQAQESSLQLRCPGDVLVEVKEEKIALTVGKLQVTLDGAGDGRVEAIAGGTGVTLKQDGDVSIKTSGKLKIEGSDIEISAAGKVKISGALVEVN